VEWSPVRVSCLIHVQPALTISAFYDPETDFYAAQAHVDEVDLVSQAYMALLPDLVRRRLAAIRQGGDGAPAGSHQPAAVHSEDGAGGPAPDPPAGP
jgi:hypothetical protein